MNKIDLKIRDILEYIKANPNCNTNPDCLDGHIVEDLYNQGYIEGSNATTMESTLPEYINLRVTIDGETYLNKLKEKLSYKYFFKKHWKYLITTTIAVMALTFIIITFFKN